MSLVKSFYNMAIIKSDLKRYWWCSAIYAVLIFLMAVLPFISQNIDGGGLSSTGDTFSASRFCSFSQMVIIPALIMPVVMGVLLFSYIQKSNTVTTMHAFPIKRSALYVSHFISGIVLITIPIIVNAFILTLYRFDHDIWILVSSRYILIWTVLTFLYSLLAFSLSVICSIVTGNTAAAFVLTYVVAALPAFVEAVCVGLAEFFVYGFAPAADTVIIEKLYYHFGNIIKDGCFGVYIYATITVLAFMLGLLFYKKRHLENHSMVVAFKALRPVLIYSFGICIGFLGFFYLISFADLDVNSFLLMVPFGIGGIIIAKMLIDWSFKPRGIIKPIIIYCGFVLLLAGFFRFDVTGFERRVPSPDEVEYACLDGSYIYSENRYDGRYINGKYYTRVGGFDPKITDIESIKAITEVHKSITDKRNMIEHNGRTTEIYYKLKNKKELVRQYYIAENREELETLFNLLEERQRHFDVLSDNPRETRSIMAGSAVFSTDMLRVDKSKFSEIIEAMKKDALVIPYDEYLKSTDLRVYIDNIYDAEDEENNPGEIIDTISMAIYPSSINTKAVLRELGFVNSINGYIKQFKVENKIISNTDKRMFICDRFLDNAQVIQKYKTEIGEENRTGYSNGKLIIDITEPNTDGDTYETSYIEINCSEDEYNWLIAQ